MIQQSSYPVTSSGQEGFESTLSKGVFPSASVTIDLTRPPDQGQAIILPNLVKVPAGGSIVWSFFDVPPGYQPQVDFVGFRPHGGDFVPSRDSPFAEHPAAPGKVTGANAIGAKGTYWYKITLVRDQDTGTEALRLDCTPESWHGSQREAGVEVGDPPAGGEKP